MLLHWHFSISLHLPLRGMRMKRKRNDSPNEEYQVVWLVCASLRRNFEVIAMKAVKGA